MLRHFIWAATISSGCLYRPCHGLILPQARATSHPQFTPHCAARPAPYLPDMLRKVISRVPGFIEPCRPSKAVRPPSGQQWIHEIKHDGFRLMVRRDGSRIRCFTKNGHDWGDRFPGIVLAARRLRAESFLIDGEVVVLREDGRSDFNALRGRRRNDAAVLLAFDLVECKGKDLRDVPLLHRKMKLRKVLGRTMTSIQFNDHFTDDGETVFRHVCQMGLEGVVSKRIDAPYRSGLSWTWLKSKNPLSEAVQREGSEDWSRLVLV
jgi:bifunctional non-homologous end joining protein LigD